MVESASAPAFRSQHLTHTGNTAQAGNLGVQRGVPVGHAGTPLTRVRTTASLAPPRSQALADDGDQDARRRRGAFEISRFWHGSLSPMAWFLFIDESGHDRTASPYEVLAGVAIHDQALREVIDQLHQAEIRAFGRRYSDGKRELKGRVLLKNKVYRQKGMGVQVDQAEIPALAQAALDCGAQADARMLKALAIAKVAYRLLI